jgi:hypothetical protein
MRSEILRLIACVIVVSLTMIGCDGVTQPEPVDPLTELKQRLAQSPRENEEAEEIALWLSGEIVAPETLYVQVRDALTRLRDAFGDSVPCLDSISYRHTHQVSYLYLGMNACAVERIREGTYHGWDSLNALYRVTSIDTSWFSEGWLDMAELRFEGRLNPVLLDEYYEGLSGVGFVDVQDNYLGDGPNLYPWMSESGFTFLLRNTWGCYPTWCPEGHFWYFKEIDQQPVLVGDYLHDQQSEWPDWWAEANDSYCAWFIVDHCPGD